METFPKMQQQKHIKSIIASIKRTIFNFFTSLAFKGECFHDELVTDVVLSDDDEQCVMSECLYQVMCVSSDQRSPVLSSANNDDQC